MFRWVEPLHARLKDQLSSHPIDLHLMCATTCLSVQQLRAVLQSKRLPHELLAQIRTSVLEETLFTFLLPSSACQTRVSDHLVRVLATDGIQTTAE